MNFSILRTAKYQILFYLAIAVWLVSLPFHPINIDDAWMGEVAYWVSQGTARLASFGNHLGLGTQIFFYHKGLVHQGVAIIQIFGFNPFALKALSVFYSFLVIGSIYFWQRRLSWNRNTFFLASSLFVSSQIVFEFGFTFRAETAVAFLILNSTLLAVYSKSKRSALLSGMLVGIAVYTHINSLIFGVSTAAIFIVRKEFGRVLVFGMTSALFSLLYFLDINSIANWNQLVTQFLGHGGVSSKSDTSILLRILGDQKRYFHTLREASISLIALYLIFKRKDLRPNEITLLHFLGVSAILLAIVAQSTTPRYLIYFLPLLYIVFSEFFFRRTKKTAVVLIFIMLTANWAGNIQFLHQRDKKLTTEEMSTIAESIPKEAKILAPFEFFFVAAGRFNFYTMDYFEIWARDEKDNTRFNALVKQHSIEYILTNNQWNRMTHLGSDGALTCIRDWCLFKVDN